MRLLLFYYVLVLLHGAVYPYALTEGLPAGAIGAFAASALTLPDPWTITAQTAVFVPLGLLAMLALAGPGQALRRLPLVLLFGAIVAVMVQAARLYVPDATASLNAVLWHILGVGLGAIWAAALRRRRSDHEADPSLARSALLLLTLWLTLRLLPLAPSLDADVVRESLRPLLVYPGFEIPTFLVETGFWLAAACLLHHLAGPRRVAGRLLLLAAATLLAAAVIVDNQVSVGDVAAVLTAWLSYGLVIKRLPGRTLLVAVLMLAAAGYQAALPPASAAAPGGISWLPFATLWREVSLVEFVRLGRMLVLWALVIWLFGAAGLGRWLGIGIAFLAALALAALGLFLAGTGADSSGPVLALLAGLLMLLVGPRRRRTGAALLDTTPAVHEAQAPAPPPVPVDEVEVETPPPPPPVAAAPQAVLETAPPARPLDPWMFILPLFWGVLLLGLFTGGLIAPRFGDWSNVLLVWLASRSVLACLALAALSLWLGAGSALGGRLVASHRWPLVSLPMVTTVVALPAALLLLSALGPDGYWALIGEPAIYVGVTENGLWGSPGALLVSMVSAPGTLDDLEGLFRGAALLALLIQPLTALAATFARLNDFAWLDGFRRLALLVIAGVVYALCGLPWWVLAKIVGLDLGFGDGVASVIAPALGLRLGGAYLVMLWLVVAGAIIGFTTWREIGASRLRPFFGITALLAAAPFGWLFGEAGLTPEAWVPFAGGKGALIWTGMHTTIGIALILGGRILPPRELVLTNPLAREAVEAA